MTAACVDAEGVERHLVQRVVGVAGLTQANARAASGDHSGLARREHAVAGGRVGADRGRTPEDQEGDGADGVDDRLAGDARRRRRRGRARNGAEASVDASGRDSGGIVASRLLSVARPMARRSALHR